MLIKMHPPMTVLFIAHQTSLADLGNFAAVSVKELYRYVADLDLMVCGPQYWFYYGLNAGSGAADQPPLDTRLTLEVALPVNGRIPTALIPYCKEVPSLKCLSFVHEGSWDGLSGVHKTMHGHIQENGLTMSGIYAEVYLNIDPDHPERNITEVRIGLN